MRVPRGRRPSRPSARVERRDVLRRGALLRAVRRRRALRAEERVRHVAGDAQAHLGEARVELAEVDRGARRRARRPGGTASRVRVERPRPERLEHAGPAVGRGAPAEPEDDVRGPRRRGAARTTRRCRASSRAGPRASRSSAGCATGRTPPRSRRPRAPVVGAQPAARRSAGRAGRGPRPPRTLPAAAPPRARRASPRRRRRGAPARARRRAAPRASRPRAPARPRREVSEPLNESGATTIRRRRRTAPAAARAVTGRARAGRRPRPRPAAARGTRGCGSSAGARGRPAR